jgi:pilus assembly protein CpaB
MKDIGARREYATAVGENVFRPEDVNRLLGRRLKYGLKKNDPVWWTHVELAEGGPGGLAAAIPEPDVKSAEDLRVERQRRAMLDGETVQVWRAVSITVSGADAVSGMVQPQDKVDVLGTFTIPSETNPQEVESVTLTLMENVSVLAVGQQTGNDLPQSGRRSRGYSTVTLKVSPVEAEILVFTQHSKSQLALALRNPGDEHLFNTESAGNKYQRIGEPLPAIDFSWLLNQARSRARLQE